MKNEITNIKYQAGSIIPVKMDLDGETYEVYETIIDKIENGKVYFVNVPRKAYEAGCENWELVAVVWYSHKPGLPEEEYTFYKVHCADGETINIFSDHNN